MLLPFQKPPLAVDSQPRLGPVLLDVTYHHRAAPAQPPPPATLDDVLRLVGELRHDVLALRVELYERSAHGRWTRVIAWIRRSLSRLRGA